MQKKIWCLKSWKHSVRPRDHHGCKDSQGDARAKTRAKIQSLTSPVLSLGPSTATVFLRIIVRTYLSPCFTLPWLWSAVTRAISNIRELTALFCLNSCHASELTESRSSVLCAQVLLQSGPESLTHQFAPPSFQSVSCGLLAVPL